MAIASTAANAAAKLGYKERDMVFSPVESRWNHDRLELSRRLGAILTADAATEPLVEYIRRREFRRRHWGEQRYKGAFSLVALAGLARIVGGYAAAAAGRACSSRHGPRSCSRRMRSRCHSCSSRGKSSRPHPAGAQASDADRHRD